MPPPPAASDPLADSDPMVAPAAARNGSARAARRVLRLRFALLAALLLSLAIFIVGAVLAVLDRNFSTQSAVIGTAGFMLFLAVCTVGGYADNWAWTGVGPFTHKRVEDEDFEPGKTLWDALQLLIIPLALAVLGLWFTARQNEADQARNDQQRTTDLQIADDHQQDGVLDTYLDHMSDLVLTKGLRPPKPNHWAAAIARARTVAALRRLNSRRNAFLIGFLADSKLMPYINVSGTDLGGAQLASTSLPGIHLIRTRLAGADLQGAHLEGAQLQNANLNAARLDGAFLSGANLDGAFLSGAQLSGSDSSLQYATLTNVDLSNTTMHDADLTGANLTSANLTRANLSSSPQATIGTLLNGANLSGATILSTNLDGVDLTGADLRGATLTGATLDDATLTRTDLRGANDTKGLSITGAYWNHTLCPDGTDSATNHTRPQSCLGHGF